MPFKFLSSPFSFLPGTKDPRSDVTEFSDADPCAACANPCEKHPQLPEYLSRKIDHGDMRNSVKPYARHLYLFIGRSSDWSSHLDTGLPKDIETAMSTVALKGRTLLTACDPMEAEEPTSNSNSGESQAISAAESDTSKLLLFPDMIELTDISKVDAFAAFLAEAQAKNISPAILAERYDKIPQLVKPIQGKAWIFICTHKKRDKRCGVAGPMLVEAFKTAIKEMKLENEVFAYGSSHFGGHKFAGNVIVYHRSPAVSGHWYGRVKTCDVQSILQTTVLEEKILTQRWRGSISHETIG